MVELLRWRSLHQSESLAYTFLSEGEDAEERLTYAMLERRARIVAARLQEMGAKGERVLLLYPAGLAYVEAFFGCLYAGATAVPAYPPRPHRPMPRIRTIVADARPAVALTSSAVYRAVAKRLPEMPDLEGLRWCLTDDLDPVLAEDWRDPRLKPESLAFLQYTSGSTAAPKGVMVSHANLLHNQRLIRDACRHGSETPVVSWLPLYHDMGLIGNLVQTLYIGAPCTLMAPVTFLKRPRRWLEAISHTRAHTSGGPNFAYDLCVRRIPPAEREGLDLSSWRLAFNGAEPVRAATLERFVEAFEPYGFRRGALFPCYGMAETTLIVSGGSRDEGPVVESFGAEGLERHQVEKGDGRDLVGSGRPLAGMEVRIVEPESRATRSRGEVGEIWVAGPSVCQGYWGQEEKTAETFRATTAAGEGPYLRTGDMGFVHDGSLYVTGRLKDLVIIRGQNHYPQDIEETVEQSHEALRPGCGAAFSVDEDGEERLVVVQEVARTYRKVDVDEVVGAVRQALAEEHELDLHALVLIREGSVHKTTSGKIQRSACRKSFEDGSLRTVAEWRRQAADLVVEDPTAPLLALGDLEDWLSRQIAERLGVAAGGIDLSKSVLHYGLDSLAAIELAHAIETRLSVSVSLETLLEGGSVAAVARELWARMEVIEPSREAGLVPAPEPLKEAPLSQGQRALWFLHRLEPNSPAYNLGAAVALAGDVDVTALGRAFEALVERHAVLRTRFPIVAGEPIQWIADAREARVTFGEQDARAWSEEELTERLNLLVQEPFDLEAGPLVRFHLLARRDRHVALFVMHHIVSDFWSLAVVMHELAAAYGAVRAGRPPEEGFEPLPLAYADYVRWQGERLAASDGERLRAYWAGELAGKLPEIELPTDRPRPPVQTYDGAVRPFRLDAAVTAELKALGRRRGATLFSTLLAAFQVLLHRQTGQRDVVVGSPTAGRTHARLASLVGYFVNPVALRSKLDGDPSFTGFLEATGEVARRGLEHQEYPFATLVQELQPVRDPSRSPLFQVMFAMQTAPRLGGEDLTAFALSASGATIPFADLVAESVALEQRIAQFDLTLSVGEVAGTVAGLFDYNVDLFDATTAGRMVHHFSTLAAGIASDPGRRLSELPILAPEEREQLVRTWNEMPGAALPAECIHQLFETSAAEHPDALAVVFEERRLRYGELEARSRRLAGRLRRRGVGPETRVGLLVERSPELLVGLLAVLRAGGAYVPLDPAYPEERLGWILRDAAVEVGVFGGGKPPDCGGGKPPGLAAGIEWLALDEDHGEPPSEKPPRLRGANAACVIYTSGSTGRPKGAVIEHRNLVRLISSFAASYEPVPEDRMLPVTAITSASFLGEVLPALSTGGAVVMPTQEELLDFVELISLIARHHVSILSTVPTVLAGLAEMRDELPRLRLILSGGEAVEHGDVSLLMETAEVVNSYGLTEATVCSTIHYLKDEDFTGRRAIPIGRPLAQQQVYVLDGYLRPQPVGCRGELAIGGRCLSRGYQGHPGRTAAAFVPSPFRAGERLYLTGDQGRWTSAGELEYLGRDDQQIQLRGFRIELGEVETALGRHPSVRQEAVMVRQGDPGQEAGEKLLAAYVVLHSGEEPAPGQLLAHLHEQLPDYMVPGAIVFLDALPLLPNGKVDRAALPVPEKSRPELEEAYTAPRSELEQRIAEVIKDVLKIEQVGVLDNFFDLGGHSLLLARAHARLREQLDRELSLIDLFKHPTVASLAAALSSTAESGPAAARQIWERAELARRRSGRRPEIAIVGLGGRFPGARNPAQLWENLIHRVESIRFFSDDELEEAGVPGEYIRHPNYVKAKGVLGDVDRFDAHFFGHNPRVAELMDPQHRVFLECSWEALENAGYDADRYAGRIGVFAGQSMNTYWLNNLYHHIDLVASVDSLEAAIGNDKDSLTTEVSYRMNLKGPSVNVQSSSSTSLTAIHFACQSLASHECEMAISGGASIHLPEVSGYFYQEGGTTAPDGHCRTFDAAAKGFVSGHGVGVVVLKRLEDALADGDEIHAVIKGSACNNDGSLKVSYMAPSVDGHAEVVASAQAAAGVTADTIGYVEAHGTGTLLGDPIEVAALTQAFRLTTDKVGYCALGSLKTNIGHLDTAAGVSGLIKAAHILKYKMIPPILHFEKPNPKIDFETSPFFVNDELRPFERRGTPLRAGVSSLGMGGTNTHVVLEEPPPETPASPSRPWQLVLLSARTPSALEAATDNLAAHLEARPELDFADAAYTLQVGRKQFAHRRMLVAAGAADAAEALVCRAPERVFTDAREAGHRGVAFLFSGQGAQYVNMGRELYETEPTFRREVDRASELLRPYLFVPGVEEEPGVAQTGGADLTAFLYPREESPEASDLLRQTAVTQPALFVVEVALAALWREWGVEPEAVIGHSVGEYAAAHLAGVLSLEDALRLVAVRGRLIQRLPSGSMLAVPLPAAEVEPRLSDEVALATVNRLDMCVVAGTHEAVAALEKELAGRELECRRLHTSHAFHSPMMEPMLDEFLAELRQVELRAPRLPWVSTLTGTWIRPEEATEATYWTREIRNTVRFADAVGELLDDGERILLELGPGNALATAARQHPARRAGHAAFPSLRHPKQQVCDSAFLLGTLGRLWLEGLEIDTAGFYAYERRRRRPLPTYPFERQRYWVEPGVPATAGNGFRRNSPHLTDWFHLPVWKQSPQPFVEVESGWAGEEGAPWLLFSDPGSLEERLSGLLAAAGQRVVTARPGERFARLGPESFTLRPGERTDYEELLAGLGGLPRRILHLWNLDGDARSLDEHLDRGFYSLLALAQACGRASGDGKPDGDPLEVLVASDHLHDVSGDEPLVPAKALLLGPCRAMPQEVPNVRCRAVDVTNHVGPGVAEILLHETTVSSPAATVAYRGYRRWVLDFEQVPIEGSGHPSRLRDRGVYLVTGGLGGMGLEVAEYLVRQARARLVLVGRSPLPPRESWSSYLAEHDGDAASRKIRRIRMLEKLGGEVLERSADVTDRAAMAEVVAAARKRFGVVHGVIHAAGVPSGGLMQFKTPEDAAAVLRPKVEGALVLDEIFDDAELDFMVLFSSVTAILVQLGQADYAAANAFLDFFAHERSARRGRRTLAINWDAWREVGMAVTTEVPEELRGWRQESLRQGLSSEEGVEAFARILASGYPQTVVSRESFAARLADHTRKRALDELEEAAQERPAHARPDLASAFTAPRNDTEETLAAIWREHLKLEEVGIDDNFFDLGGNSLMGLKLLSQIKKELGAEMTEVTLFDRPTIRSLATFLAPPPEEAETEKVRAGTSRGERRRGRRGRRRQAKETADA